MRRDRLRFLFVPYRWGADLMGGAERHHRCLAQELVELGHEVTVWTTTAHNFRPVRHWGALWTEFKPAGIERDGAITVRRFPARRQSPLLVGALSYLVQRHYETHPMVPDRRALLEAPLREPVLGTDWHEAEPNGAQTRRWSWVRSTIHLDPECTAARRLRVRLHTPWQQTIVLGIYGATAGSEKVVVAGKGSLTLEIALREGVSYDRAVLSCLGARRPGREFRYLGAFVDGVSMHDAEGGLLAEADLMHDARRAVSQDTLWAWAATRPGWMNRAFDYLRGPNSPALARAVARIGNEFDVVVSANFPWRVHLPPRRREGALRCLLALLHPGDSYYYWSHYLKYLQDADLVLANTPYSEEVLFRPLGIRARFVGPGFSPDALAQVEPAPRPPGAPMRVLTVCRKSPEKKYGDIVSSVHRLRASGVSVEFVGVGPDLDGVALGEGAQWLGRLDGDALARAYREADVFALMSESESFGMVVAEAWHAGLPVVVNPRCGPVASLVADGIDGLLARPGAELDAAIRRLAEDGDLRRRLGAAGRTKAERLYVPGAAAKRFLAAIEEVAWW